MRLESESEPDVKRLAIGENRTEGRVESKGKNPQFHPTYLDLVADAV